MSKQNKEKVLRALKEKNFVKIISGIRNYDKQKVIDVVTAAEFGEATAVDICDKEEIIEAVRGTIELPLFVSSIDPQKLIKAQELGADVLEIGNFENLDKNYTADEVLEIAKEVKASLNEDTLLCCTVPGNIEIEAQIQLAKSLVNLGVDIIQTEGSDKKVEKTGDETLDNILKASSTLSNTAQMTAEIPYAKVITASGITPTTAPYAIGSGACGIGIGNYISREPYQAYMTEKVKEVVSSVNKFGIRETDTNKVLTFNLK